MLSIGSHHHARHRQGPSFDFFFFCFFGQHPLSQPSGARPLNAATELCGCMASKVDRHPSTNCASCLPAMKIGSSKNWEMARCKEAKIMCPNGQRWRAQARETRERDSGGSIRQSTASQQMAVVVGAATPAQRADACKLYKVLAAHLAIRPGRGQRKARRLRFGLILGQPAR